ncbi:MAG TPA: hypothetical protein DCM28_04610, partial [Phycisphaerales bacterium]|nr:hypothetical protein [Phycisphaerales bacterium]
MIRRILLALGGTPFSEVALRRAIELAKLHDAQITAVPIVDSDYWKASIYRTNLSATAAVRLLETRPWELAEQRVRQIITDFEHQCECQEIPHTVLEPGGDPIHMLITQSRQHDLVIFGLRGLFDFTVVPDPAGTVARLVREGVSPMIAAAPTYRDIRRVLIAYSGST